MSDEFALICGMLGAIVTSLIVISWNLENKLSKIIELMKSSEKENDNGKIL